MLASLMFVILAGGMNGSFAVPMKRVRGWQWEHTWLVWSFLGMLVIPLSVALVTIPGLGTVYLDVGLQPLALTALYGMIWGAGTALFGLGITRVGVALSFGIILGISSSLGTVLPLVILHRNQLLTNNSLLVLLGAAVILVGVAAIAKAGTLRESGEARQTGEGSFAVGVGICLLAGLCSSSMSFALNESVPISKAAEAFGASPAVSLNAVWPVFLGGGLAVNAIYCILLLIRRGNFARFKEEAGFNIALVVAMAVLWSGSNFVYGAGARGLGPLGLVLGWPIFMAVIVLTANGWGLLTGEWKNARPRALMWAAGGGLLLVLGICVIASTRINV